MPKQSQTTLASLFARVLASWPSARRLPSMPTISTQEFRREVHGYRFVWRLRRADGRADAVGMAGYGRVAPAGRPLWHSSLCLAPGLVRVCRLHDCPFVPRLAYRGSPAMTVAEFKPKGSDAKDREAVRSTGRRVRIIPVLI